METETIKKVSNDRRLNDIIFDMSEQLPVFDRDTNKLINALLKRTFSISIPYRVGKIITVLPLEEIYNIFDAGFSKPRKEITMNKADIYIHRFLKYHNFLVSSRDSLIPHREIELLYIKPALKKEPQPALDKGKPLNAFYVKGILYYFSIENPIIMRHIKDVEKYSSHPSDKN